MIKAILLISFLIYPLSTYSQSQQILIDGVFSDWENYVPIYIDPINDSVSNTIDFKRIWVSSNTRFIFFQLEIDREINIQNPNSIILFLDTDTNSETGKKINGIGAELKWDFGNKGTLYVNQDSLTISHSDIGLVTSPTVTSARFEIALDRFARPYGQKLFLGESFRIVFVDKNEGGDLMPNVGVSITYNFDNGILSSSAPLSLRKQKPYHVRILTYNILKDGLFDTSRAQFFERIIKGVNPDILGFQEVFNHTAEQTASVIESILSTEDQQRWYYSKVEPDIIAISRYPIIGNYVIPGNNGAFLINLNGNFDTKLLLIVAHPPCCNNNAERQFEIDALMAFIRDAQNSNGIFNIERNTPILITGDMNFVGFAHQLENLLTGNIVNKSQFGMSFLPDWDATPFTDLMPRHINSPFTYTWYDQESLFSPGRLDFMVYSDSVMDVGNHFVLFTPEVSSDSLAAYGLQAQDVVMASDHLPVVADFIFSVNQEK